MKRLLSILIISLSVACCQAPPPSQPPKFKEGEVVYVVGEAFIVDYYSGDNYYRLKKIDCKSETCMYGVQESEISKTKQ